MTLRAAIIRELVMIRDGLQGLSEFSRDDVCAFISCVCVCILICNFNFSFV